MVWQGRMELADKNREEQQEFTNCGMADTIESVYFASINGAPFEPASYVFVDDTFVQTAVAQETPTVEGLFVHVVEQDNGAGGVNRSTRYDRESLAVSSDSDTVYSYLTDQVMRPRMVFDALGNSVYQPQYDPFGNIVGYKDDIGIDFYQPLRFANQYFDDESGLHYNWNRYYDPVLGQYTTVDKVREVSGGNYIGEAIYRPEVLAPYELALNNIIRYVDANGLETTDPQPWTPPGYVHKIPERLPELRQPDGFAGELVQQIPRDWYQKGLSISIISGIGVGSAACGTVAATSCIANPSACSTVIKTGFSITSGYVLRDSPPNNIWEFIGSLLPE